MKIDYLSEFIFAILSLLLFPTQATEPVTNDGSNSGTVDNLAVTVWPVFNLDMEHVETGRPMRRQKTWLTTSAGDGKYLSVETNFRTENTYEYSIFHVWATAFYFEVRAHSGAILAVMSGQDNDSVYEIILGAQHEKWTDSKSMIRKKSRNTMTKLVDWTDTPELLSLDEFRGFWVHLYMGQGEIRVGKHGEPRPFLMGIDASLNTVTKVGFSANRGKVAYWRLLRDCFDVEPQCNEEERSIINGYAGNGCGLCRAGVAPPVTNLTVKSVDATAVAVSWEAAKIQYINVTEYELSYEHRAFLACGTGTNDRGSRGNITVKDADVRISNLHPYSLYTLSVRAVVDAGGVVTTADFRTAPAPPQMSPEPSSTTEEATFLWFQWTIPDSCREQNGEIMDFFYQLYGESPWMKGLIEEGTTREPAFYALHLIPFSRYRLRVYIRNHGNIMNLQKYIEMSAQTKKSAPPAPVLLAMNHSSSGALIISLGRPYPPHGQLQYFILCYSNARDGVWRNITVEQCIHGEGPCVFNLTNFKEHLLSNEPIEDVKVKVMACNEDALCGKWSDIAGNTRLTRSGGVSWSKPSEDPAGTGLVVGAVCGTVVGVAVLTFLVFMMYRYRRYLTRPREGYYVAPTTDRQDGNFWELPEVSPLKFSSKMLSSRNATIPPQVRPSPTVPLLPMRPLSRRVQVLELQDYVYTAITNRELQRQHMLLPRGCTKSCDYGKKPELKSRNRYVAILPYDDSRVVLDVMEGDSFSDYINANYVDGYKKPKAYIATQGPKQTTIIDLWRAVWQESVAVIVMLTNLLEKGLRKCEQYWPNAGEQQYGDFRVLLLGCSVYADYTVRKLQVKKGSEERQVTQIHFTSWPDHGVPNNPQPVALFVRKLSSLPRGSGPVVVHCSAGVGRTGTIILIDAMLEMAEAEGAVDMLRHFQIIRSQRMNLVDSYDQYKFVHLVLVEVLLREHLTIPRDKMDTRLQEMCQLDPSQGFCDIERQFTRLEREREVQETVVQFTVNHNITKKTREQALPPGDHSRVHLQPSSESDSDYINATFVNGFRANNEFICTQLPLSNTVADFWRMIEEFRAQTIVVLHELATEEVDACFCPTVKKPVKLIQTTVTLRTETHIGTVCRRTLCLENTQRESRDVTLLQLSGWSPAEDTPDQQALLTLCREVERIKTQERESTVMEAPLIVVCLDGVSGCGPFLVLSILCDEIRMDNEIDVYQTVRTIRRSRPQFVQNLKQYKFCYDVVAAYLKTT